MATTPRALARDGDVVPHKSPGTTYTAPGVSLTNGTWAPGSVVPRTLAATTGTTAVVTSASCTFTFTGTLPNGNPGSATSTVSLKAGTHPLRVRPAEDTGVVCPLLEGDHHEDAYGNQLIVESGGTWRSG